MLTGWLNECGIVHSIICDNLKVGRLQIPLRREKNGQVAFWSPCGLLRAVTRAHTLAGDDPHRVEAQDQPRVATAGTCARQEEAAPGQTHARRRTTPPWQALALGREPPLPGEPGPAPAPVCPAPRTLCASRTQGKQVLFPPVIRVDLPSLYPLCLHVANREDAGLDGFTLPSRLAVSGCESLVVLCGGGACCTAGLGRARYRR